MTVEDVNAAVRDYLADTKAWRFEVDPVQPSQAVPPGAVPVAAPPASAVRTGSPPVEVQQQPHSGG